MKYCLTTLLLILTAIVTDAQTNITLEQMPSAYGDLMYHVRLKPDKKNIKWGVVWNYLSADSYSGLEVTANLNDVSVDTDRQPIYATIYNVNGSERTNVSTETVYDSGDLRKGLSIRLRMNDAGAVAEIGTAMPVASMPIDLHSDGGYGIGMYYETPMTVARKSLTLTEKDEAQYAPFSDLKALTDYFAKSSDAFEGFWSYLDRDTDANKVNLGGDYKFATVKIDNRYALVYISGARTNAEAWQQMRIKAWLVPTIFIGNYDLIWYDPFGERFDVETSAAVTDNAIIAFNFPLYKSSVRWRRVTAGDIL